MPDVNFECNCPILRVSTLAASIDYYVQKLGFKVDWQTAQLVSMSRGRSCIFLSEGDQGHPGSWVWIGVSDVAALFEEYMQTGAKVRHRPTNYVWAYEMQVEDPDGNILRIGSESRAGEPVGEWLDMDGDRWVHSPENGWVRPTD
jgi:catechol 2,3-dioxygenase-like lactoylglutathione lyase family enzyme